MRYRVKVELEDDEGEITESHRYVTHDTSDLSDALADVLAFVLQAPSTFDEPCRTAVLYQFLGLIRTDAKPLHELGWAYEEWTAYQNFEDCYAVTINREKLTQDFPGSSKAQN